MAVSTEMGFVEVSAEMLTLLGAGDVGGHRWPPRPVAFEFDVPGPEVFQLPAKPLPVPTSPVTE